MGNRRLVRDDAPSRTSSGPRGHLDVGNVIGDKPSQEPVERGRDEVIAG